MLLSDGSVTRHLQLMTGLKVSVECLEMRRLKDDMDMSALPRAVSLIQGPLLQRQVLLHLPEPLNRAYVYAVSWWNADTVERYLKYVCAVRFAVLMLIDRYLRTCLNAEIKISPFGCR